jgi:hypothetical protein
MARLLNTNTAIKLKVNIKPVKLAEVTPWQRQLVKDFWSRLIAQVQEGLKTKKEWGKK